MLKHITGQTIFQIIVLLVITFLADKFVPESINDSDSEV